MIGGLKREAKRRGINQKSVDRFGTEQFCETGQRQAVIYFLHSKKGEALYERHHKKS